LFGPVLTVLAANPIGFNDLANDAVQIEDGHHLVVKLRDDNRTTCRCGQELFEVCPGVGLIAVGVVLRAVQPDVQQRLVEQLLSTDNRLDAQRLVELLFAANRNLHVQAHLAVSEHGVVQL
jgi:hypothetical protein